MQTRDNAWRGWRPVMALAVFLCLGVSILTLVPIVREAQIRLSDTLFWMAPLPSQRSPLVVVTIDERSLELYGRWPWSRSRLADLLNKITESGATTVGFDILLAESESTQSDAAFQAALRKNRRTVLVDKIGILASGPQWVEPIPEFATSAAAVGHTHAVLDIDGICRRFQPIELSASGERYAFAIELARQVDPSAGSRFAAKNQYLFPINSSRVAMAKPVTVRIAFRRDGFDRVRAADVLQGKNLAIMKGRAVLVGFGPTDIGDRVSTPLATELPVPGVEVHAQILDSILTGRYVREATIWLSSTLLFTCCLLTVVVCRRWRGLAVGLALPVLAAAVYIAGLVGFVFLSLILPVGPMLLAVALGPILVSTVDMVSIERSTTQQLSTLRRLLSKHSEAGRSDNKKPDLTLRMDLLEDLQSTLGSRYELYEALLEATQDIIAIFDDRGDLLLSNKAFASRFGLSVINSVTLTSLLSQFINNPDAGPIARGPSEEREVFVGDELYLMRMGPLPPTSLCPRGGTIVTLSSLRNRVERDRARSEALGFITHELRTPLASIQGFAELIMHDPVSSVAEGAPETIYRESQRLLALIGSYLDVLRLDAGAKPITSHVIDLEGLIDQVLTILKPMAGSAGMSLIAHAPEPITFTGDAPLISGAVLNLVSNAIKYGRPNTDVHVTCFQNADHAVIAVQNEGAAIPKEEMPRLFDTYYRASNVDTGRNGWGLGLAFVKRIADKHGGSVTAESREGRTTFEIHLPICVDSSEAGEAHEASRER